MSAKWDGKLPPRYVTPGQQLALLAGQALDSGHWSPARELPEDTRQAGKVLAERYGGSSGVAAELVRLCRELHISGPVRDIAEALPSILRQERVREATR